MAKVNLSVFILIVMSCVLTLVLSSNSSKKLQIGVKKRATDCPMKTKKGDLLHMHYTVI